MAKSSGGIGVHGGLNPGDGNYTGSVRNIETLKNIKHRQVYNEVGSAISRYHAVLGVREKNIKLADLSAGTLGVHVSSGGKSEANGRKPKLYTVAKKCYNLSYDEFTDVVHYLFQCTKKEIDDIATADDTPV